MSTFDGIIEEFPLIRVDYFRKNPERPPPLACFLSHVHSDHLQGLESFRSPFIYCSAATREILLRLEKYPHRMNFSKGILESRKQHYKHLVKLLRPIPLQVPTEIELMPRTSIRVTLFDANHCPGAVMFLIEGGGKSILYTGDIRAEAWWVDNLIGHPILIPYTLGVKRLDKIYLDTTFATKSNIYTEFTSKAEGIRELLEKVQKYPDDTTFYFRSWTFGYEEVWLALSSALNTQIHVDRYQLGIYKALTLNSNDSFGSSEGLWLCGFKLGNAQVPGCLSQDKSARVHSCEPIELCTTISSGQSVYITPIVTRTQDGSEVAELGAGGGLGDLYQTHELELPDEVSIQQLLDLCAEQISDPESRETVVRALTEAYSSKRKSLLLDDYGIKEEDDISLQRLIQLLSRGPKRSAGPGGNNASPTKRLSNTIRFPYSRHSSYGELCLLVKAFKPKDVFPCTVDANTWSDEVSIENLFGNLCSGRTFTHDSMMRETIQPNRSRKRQRRDSDSSARLSTQQSSRGNLELPDDVASPSEPSVQIIEPHAIPARNALQTSTSQKTAQDGKRPRAEPPKHDSSVEFIDSQQLWLTQSSSSFSSTANLQAIRDALKAKAQSDELDFYLPSSFLDSQASVAHHHLTQHDQHPLHEEAEGHMRASTSQSVPATPDNFPAHFSLDSTEGQSDAESSISLSGSAFDSQCSDTLDPSSPDDDDPEPDIRPRSKNSLVTSSTARAMRIAAYRAAKSDGCEMWSNVFSPVTAGNNHSEVEVEL